MKAGAGVVQPGARYGLALSANGSEYFAGSYSSAWSGVVGVFPATGKGVEISQFADPDADQVWPGAFDGRWLVWSESDTLQDPVPVTVLAWDSRTNTLVTVSNTPSSARLSGITGADAAALKNGALVWTQITGEQSTVHLSNLDTQTDRIIFRGQAGSPVFWGTKILFSIGHQSENRLVAYSSRTGQPSELPPGLVAVRGITALAATPAEVVWTEADGTSTWVWRAGYEKAEEVGSDYQGASQPAALADSDFVWTTGQSSMIADPRSGSVAVFPTGYGVIVANGDFVLTGHTPPGESKASRMPVVISVLDVSKLPALPRCPR